MSKQHSLTVEISTELGQPAAHEAVAVCVFEDAPHASFKAGDDLQSTCEALVRSGEFKGQTGTSQLFYQASANGTQPRRLLLLGLSSRADMNAHVLQRAAGLAARAARAGRIKHLYFMLPTAGDQRSWTRAVAEGATLGLYEVDFYQNKEEETPELERLTVVANADVVNLHAEVERARIIAEAVNWTRALADEPGAGLPPREFARRATEMAEEFGLIVETLDAEEVRARGMGGLWGVGRGSEEKPALIVIRYEPEGTANDNANATAADELWAFVGKGITFDTGGISLKHGLDMYEMKTDMAGGAAVLGALRAIAQLKPPQRVVGIIPAAENMPSGHAIKPGDVIKTFAGYTIEVVDTDAEGRLVLADGIAYARSLGAKRIVDLATLTGSIIIALGDKRTGLFSNDDAWAKRVTDAATRAGEPVWRMPVSDDYKKRIESPIADFKNYGGRPDATAAALLLSKFAAGTPWVHLDIAGTAWYDEAQPHAPKGSSGTGVRTLVELVCGDDAATS
ncbi:MAG TPA: leucyl aminopeptidase [Pyrinomonadaceae bacterium]|jgi:leucyl aminopeptidase|nr:leucyl aminopeptidase [Pyrinomonadaceae bacterium]